MKQSFADYFELRKLNKQKIEIRQAKIVEALTSQSREKLGSLSQAQAFISKYGLAFHSKLIDSPHFGELVEFHSHTKSSHDGVYSVDEMVDKAAEFGVKMYAITNHDTDIDVNEYIFDNNLQHNYFAYIHDRNGNILIPGLEGTVFHKLSDGSVQKLHMVILAPAILKHSQISKLYKLKYEHDKIVDRTLVDFVNKHTGYHITDQQLEAYVAQKRAEGIAQSGKPQFRRFNPDDIIQILKDTDQFSGNPYSLKKTLSKVKFPDYLKLDSADVLTMALASQALVIVAHVGQNVPAEKQEQLAKELVELGVHGFETDYYKSPTNDSTLFEKAFKFECAKLGKIAITSGGTDYHGEAAVGTRRAKTMGQINDKKLFAHNYTVTKAIEQCHEKRALNKFITYSKIANGVDNVFVNVMADIDKASKLTLHRMFKNDKFDTVHEIYNKYVRMSNTALNGLYHQEAIPNYNIRESLRRQAMLAANYRSTAQ